MRLLALALALSLAACAVAPFDVTVTNVGDEVAWLSAGDSTGVLIGFQEQQSGEWRTLIRSLAFACIAECGRPGQVVCADAAAELSVVYGLLPGDSVTESFDSDWWVIDEAAGCARRTAMTGPVRANLCYGAEARTDLDEPLDPPAQSGIQGSGSGASVVDPSCESFEIDLSEGDGRIELSVSPAR